MKDENYITIQGWMVNKLKLSGNKLILYALIYGFSQDGKSKFKGSSKYLADSLGTSKQSVLELLKKLVENKLIRKHETGRGRNKKCDYGVNLERIKKFIGQKSLPIDKELVKKLDQSGQESLPMIGQESLPHNNNIHNDLDNNIRGGSNEPPISESQKTALELSELLLTSHRREFPDYLSGKTDKEIKKKIEGWAVDIEKLIRIDKKNPETIKDVILWVKTPGNFWFQNIESGKKLRDKFERLHGSMKTDNKKRAGTKPYKIAADNAPVDVGKYFKEAI